MAPILVGLALAWYWCGLRTILAVQIDFLPTTATMGTILALLLTAVGATVPERATSWVQSLIRRRAAHELGADGGGGESTTPPFLLNIARQSDAELPWISLALLSASAGLLTLFSLAIGTLAFQFHRWLLGQFFWTNITLAGMEWVTVSVVILAPCIAGGLTLVVLAAVGDSQREEGTYPGQGVAVGVVAGLGLGWFVHGFWSTLGIVAERELVIGSLPLFAVAVMGARASQRVESCRVRMDEVGPRPPELPACSEMRVGLAIMVWTIGLTIACAGWLACDSGEVSGSHETVGMLLGGIGLAAVIAGQVLPRLPVLARGCGPAIWACGVGAGLAATMAVSWPESDLSYMLQISLLSVPVGYAIHRISGYSLARASSGTLGFAQLLVTLLTGTAIGLAASRWGILPSLGAMGTVAAGSLTLLATGGLLELYEDHQPMRAQRLKLALVFASLAAAILVFPTNTQWWTRRQRAAAAASAERMQPSPEIVRELRHVRTACAIGVASSSFAEPLPDVLSRLVLLPAASSWPRTVESHNSSRRQVVPIPAPRWLRLDRDRYQLVYQLVRPVAQGGGVECSAEWLNVLIDHLAPGGWLVVDVPLEGLTRRDVLTIGATLEHVTMAPVMWRLSESSERRLLLRIGPAQIPGYRTTAVWHTLGDLTGNEADLRKLTVHSIRRPRIATGAEHGTAALIAWLRDRAGEAAPRD